MFLENIFPIFPVFSSSNVVRMSVNDWSNMQVYQNIVYIIKYIIFSRIPIL